MEPNKEQFKKICLDAVRIANRTITSLGEEGRVVVRVPGKDELVTKADLGVSNAWREYFSGCKIPIQVLTEESRNKPFATSPNPEYLGIGDELDGTRNSKRANKTLPYCGIFTILANGPEPRFEDALATAVFDHHTGDLWYAVKGNGCYFNEKRVHTSRKETIDKDTLIMIDKGPCPRPEHSLRYFALEQKCGHGNFGSAGMHLAGVASGKTNGWDGYCCMIQKPEELISGYLLISEAGGSLIDSSGNPIGEKRFDWNRTYDTIAAATPELAQLIRKELISGEKSRQMYEKIKLLDFHN